MSFVTYARSHKSRPRLAASSHRPTIASAAAPPVAKAVAPFLPLTVTPPLSRVSQTHAREEDDQQCGGDALASGTGSRRG